MPVAADPRARRRLLATCLLAAMFGVIALIVWSGRWGLDLDVATWMAAHRTPSGIALFLGLAQLGSLVVVVPATLVCAGYLIARRRAWDAAWLAVATYGAAILYTLTKLAMERPRPDADLRVMVERGFSFPSGHATQASAFWLSAAILIGYDRTPRTQRILLAVAVPLVALPAASRVYLGVHWTLDVCGGLCLGTASLLAMLELRAALARRRLRVIGG